MKKSLLLILFMTTAGGLFAQERPSMEKIEAARIGLITERLEMSAEVAQQFWPVYNSYNEGRMELRNEFRRLRHETDFATASQEESKKIIEKQFELKEKELALEKQLADELLDIISPRQFLTLKKAEEDFRRMLFDRIKDHPRGGKSGDKFGPN